MMFISQTRITDFKEKIIFVLFTVGIFLPIRFFFSTIISDYWLGSFGLISFIMIILLYLVKKNKLGYIGHIWKKQIIKISKGKLGIILIIKAVFIIIIISGMIYVTEQNTHSKVVLEMTDKLNEKGIDTIDKLLLNNPTSIVNGELITIDNIIESNLIDNFSQLDFINIFTRGITAIFEAPQNFAYSITLVNNYTYGFQQHFLTVVLVEEIEMFSFIFYFRYQHKINQLVFQRNDSKKIITLSDCVKCNTTGWCGTLICLNCNGRGKISNQLYEKELRFWMHGKRVEY